MPYDKPISYSGMSLYDKCPRQWHLRYVEGVRGESGKAAERGTRLHDLLEKYFKGEIPYPSGDKCLAPWKKYMEELKLQAPSAEAEVAVDQFWRPVPFEDPSAWFRGKKDLDIRTDEVKFIFDWKSGKIYEDHVKQGRAYVALDPEDFENYEVRFAYLDIPHHVQSWPYTHTDKVNFRTELDRKIEVIRLDDQWKPNPDDHCRWCELSWRNNGSCTAAP